MLNVSQEARQAYMSGNARTALFLTVTAEDGTGSPVIYSPTNILSGSVSIVESLCSAQAFDISRVEKNQLTFTLFNITENISDLQGKIVTAKQTITFPDDSTEDIPLGRYKIVEAVNDGDYLIKCTAYDDMLKLDAIADEWWNTDVTFPITIRDLLISMLTEVGIGTTGIPATFNNSTFEIAERTVYFDNASYSEVLGYIQEVVGAFFKIDRNGVMQMYSVEMSQTPDIEYAYQQIVSDLSVADFTVQPITALQVKGTEDDIGITVGVDGNVYVILGNPLLYNLTAQTGNTVCTNILTAISGVTYTPFTAKVMCQPYSEVGDTIALTTYKGLEAGSVVFNRTMSGARLSFDSIVSKGEQERSEVTRNVERQVTVLNQRTHEIVNDVETLSSTITQVETDLSGRITANTSAIEQNSAQIALKVPQSDYTGANIVNLINLDTSGATIQASHVIIDTSSLDLTFGSESSKVTIKATTANDGVLFDGTGKVQFHTNGEFRVENLDSTDQTKNANRIWAFSNATQNYFSLNNYNSSGTYLNLVALNYSKTNDTNYIRIGNYKTDGNIANTLYLTRGTTSNSVYLENYSLSSTNRMNFIQMNHYPNSNWNRLLFQNNWMSGSTSNWIQCSNAGETSDFQFYNYHYNGNLANTFFMTTASNSSRLELTNHDSSGVVRTKVEMKANGGLVIQTTTGGTSEITIPGQGETGTGNINIKPAGNLHLAPTGDITVGSYTGAGSGGSVTGTANPTLKNYDGRDVVLHFYKGIYTGFTFN